MAPIHGFIRYGDLGRVSEALANGTSPNLREDWTNNTPLHCAAQGMTSPEVAVELLHWSSIVSLLIEHGAEVDALNKWNETALDVAIVHGQILCVAVLLAGGASVNLGERLDDKKPTELICVKHHVLLSMLLRAGAPLPRYYRPDRCPNLSTRAPTRI